MIQETPNVDDGFSLQRRIENLFHRHEEGVHVDVEDGAHKQLYQGVNSIMGAPGRFAAGRFINFKIVGTKSSESWGVVTVMP